MGTTRADGIFCQEFSVILNLSRIDYQARTAFTGEPLSFLRWTEKENAAAMLRHLLLPAVLPRKEHHVRLLGVRWR